MILSVLEIHYNNFFITAVMLLIFQFAVFCLLVLSLTLCVGVPVVFASFHLSTHYASRRSLGGRRTPGRPARSAAFRLTKVKGRVAKKRSRAVDVAGAAHLRKEPPRRVAR